MKVSKKIVAVTAAASLLTTAGITAFAATEHWNDRSANTETSESWNEWKTEWETVKTDFEKVSLTVGADETQLNFGWYSKEQAAPAKVIMSKNADMSDSVEFQGTSKYYKTLEGVKYYSNKVTATDLEENTTYYYQYLVNGEWSEIKTTTTKSSTNFSVMYVGDPQIGASKGQTPSEGSEAQTAELAARNDAYNWNVTLNAAYDKFPNLSFILSAGDQINQTDASTEEKDLQQEYEYAGYLNAALVSQIPIATTIGNHDSQSANYQNHFNNPNSFLEETSPSVAGNGYYFSYGNALFIVINTNNYNCADHEALIKKAIEATPDAEWRIVMFHQDIYGSGLDHSDSDGIVLRTQLTPIFDEYDIDVVLQGHDHTYSRTYQLTGDGEAHTAYTKGDGLSTDEKYLEENQCYNIVDMTPGTVTDPEGTIYMEANSATGSKFYELIEEQQDYIAARSQTWTPTYSVIDFETADDGSTTSFTINTYDVDSGEKIDDSYTIVKTLDVETDESSDDVEESSNTEESSNDVEESSNTEESSNDVEESSNIEESSDDTDVPANTDESSNTDTDSAKDSSTDNNGKGESALPTTGDSSMMLFIAAIAVIISGTIIASTFKKKKAE